MITIILSLISSLFTAAGRLFDWLYAQKLVDAGRTQQQLEDLKAQINAAQIAIAAREAVRADVARDPVRVPDDDPFLRD